MYKRQLEELAKMLTPEVSNRMFTEEDLEEFSEIDIEVAALFMDVMEKAVSYTHLGSRKTPC